MKVARLIATNVNHRLGIALSIFLDAIHVPCHAPGRYPRIVECAEPLTACDDPAFHYSFGIDLFIAGVEAMTARLGG